MGEVSKPLQGEEPKIVNGVKMRHCGFRLFGRSSMRHVGSNTYSWGDGEASTDEEAAREFYIINTRPAHAIHDRCSCGKCSLVYDIMFTA